MIKMLGFRVDRYVDGQDRPAEFVDMGNREFTTINGMYSFLAEQLGLRLPRPVCGTIEWHRDIIDSSPSFEHGIVVSGTIRLPSWDSDNPACMVTILAEIVLS